MLNFGLQSSIGKINSIGKSKDQLLIFIKNTSLRLELRQMIQAKMICHFKNKK